MHGIATPKSAFQVRWCDDAIGFLDFGTMLNDREGLKPVQLMTGPSPYCRSPRSPGRPARPVDAGASTEPRPSVKSSKKGGIVFPFSKTCAIIPFFKRPAETAAESEPEWTRRSFHFPTGGAHLSSPFHRAKHAEAVATARRRERLTSDNRNRCSAWILERKGAAMLWNRSEPGWK